MTRPSVRLALIVASLLGSIPPGLVFGQITQSAGQELAIAAVTAEQRVAAARALLPMLRHVRRQVSRSVTIERGGSPDSPFTGTQTTLFAFTIAKNSTALDPKVVEAMDRLLTWKLGDPGAPEEQALFDEWLRELSLKSAAFNVLAGTELVCDTACVIARMTTLDEVWGPDPRTRADARDQMLLDAFVEVVPDD
jgi:hypothetical protein